ncbi:MAG TPA: hypothetical protein VNO51_03615 [Ilumatobacteraceae bacterium]|nr:hypothetical protein [Ilumatobacteraceae bacterium]
MTFVSPARTRAAAITALLASTALLGAACGGEDTADAAGTVTVHATDFAFDDLPDEVELGTTFELVNDSEVELHELVAVRLPDDETRSAHDIVHDGIESMFAVEPAFVLVAAPGGPQINAVGDGTVTEPGRYIVVCMIPTGVDPEEFLEAAQNSNGGPPQIENAGAPHIAHGMFGEFTVG